MARTNRRPVVSQVSRLGLVRAAADEAQQGRATLRPFTAGSRAIVRSADGCAPIADYGFVSDCCSAALGAGDGSIDWLCWPRFDSPSLFAKILDADEGGAFTISPAGRYSVERCYAPRANVLQTTVPAKPSGKSGSATSCARPAMATS
jgi:hypothetical protein